MFVYGVLLLLSIVLGTAFAQTPLVPFTDCTSSATISDPTYDPLARINISNVYAQVDYSAGRSLKLVLIGQTGKTIVPSAGSSGKLILCMSHSGIVDPFFSRSDRICSYTSLEHISSYLRP
jgi:hypothetical protein